MGSFAKFIGYGVLAAALASCHSVVKGRQFVTPNLPYDPETTPFCVDWWDNAVSFSCQNVVGMYRLSIEMFRKWNPSITEDCGNFQVGMSYCVRVEDETTPDVPSTTATIMSSPVPATSVAPGNGIQTPLPIQGGMVTNCNKFHFVQTGDTCNTIASKNAISTSQIISWNPAAGAECLNLWANTNACVGVIGGSTKPPTGVQTPEPAMPGMVNNCTKFYMVKSGEICNDISSRYSISLSQLYAWNSGIGSDCRNLWANTYVCVAASR